MKNKIKLILGGLFGILAKYHSHYKIDKYRKHYNISKSFRFNGDNIILYGKGDIIFGENSYVGEGSTWQASEGCKIKIGKNCKISHNVRAYTSTAIADSDFSRFPIPSKKGDVIIDDYAWIGANVMINPGIRIGKNSVVGANSVVTKNIPDFSIYGGVPAKLIRLKDIA